MTKTTPIRLLVVDDNPDDVLLVRQTLKRAAPTEFELASAARLEEGLALLKEHAFDIVLLDLALPDSFGIETYTTFRAHSDVPVVVLSGNPSDSLAEEALRLGAQDYLVKGSASGELLVRIVRSSIARHRLAGELRESQKHLRILCDQLPAVLWTTDLDLRFTSSRGRGLRDMGLEQDEVVGQSLFEFFKTDNPAHPTITLHRQALSGDAPTKQVRWRGRWYHSHVEPLRNGLGEIIGTIGVALDVTGERRLRRDVEAAHRIQEHLLPHRAPRLRGFDIAGTCHPAELCSGDFFDYIPMGRTRLAIVLADVSGHGFGPAIMAATIRSYLRTAAVWGGQVHEMLALCNRLRSAEAKEGDPFASVCCLCLYSETRSVQFASAGHPAIIIRDNGSTQPLETECAPIGVRPDEAFPLSRPIHLSRGDVVLMASDGLFEARNSHDEPFGEARAIEVIRVCKSMSAAEIVQQLHQAFRVFIGGKPAEDDMTVVVVKAVSRKEPKHSDAEDTVDWIEEAQK